MNKNAGVPNAHCGRDAAFASEGGGVLKNRALLNDEPRDSGEQRREMRMEDADNKNGTYRNGHDVFDIADHMRLAAGASRRGGDARIHCGGVSGAHEFPNIAASLPAATPCNDKYSVFSM